MYILYKYTLLYRNRNIHFIFVYMSILYILYILYILASPWIYRIYNCIFPCIFCINIHYCIELTNNRQFAVVCPLIDHGITPSNDQNVVDSRGSSRVVVYHFLALWLATTKCKQHLNEFYWIIKFDEIKWQALTWLPPAPKKNLKKTRTTSKLNHLEGEKSHH